MSMQGNTVDVIGYVYTTLGGTAYFVPIGSSINIFVFGLSLNSSTSIGPNENAANFTDVANAIQKFIHNGNVSNAVNCFPGGSWNGQYPA